MTIVKMDGRYKLCGTCAFWNGPRSMENGCSVFDNRASGHCSEKAFGQHKVQAVSTCVNWQLWQEGVGDTACAP